MSSILPTETSSSLLPVGLEGGRYSGEASALEPFGWFVQYCEICDQDQIFISGGLGLVACCVECGDAPFVRVSSEA